MGKMLMDVDDFCSFKKKLNEIQNMSGDAMDIDAKPEANGNENEDEGHEQFMMDDKIWGSLPRDAVEQIMLRLPLVTLLRARCVSKSWRSTIASKTFTDLYTRECKQNAWLLIFPNNDVSSGLAYDPSSRKWLDLSFRFLPFESKVVATAEGMACMIPKTSHHKEWLACNPITKVWRSIPCPPGLFKLFFLVVGLFVDVEDSSFKVIMAGSELVAEDSEKFNLATEVYDSKLNYWKKGGSMLLDAPLSPWRATCQGIMYCVTGSLPYRVLAYDVDKAVWFEVKAPMPAKMLTSVRLIDHSGRLLLVGGVGNHGVTTKIGMWKLDTAGAKWTELGWMPTEHCTALLQSLSRRFVCIGQGNFLYFSNKCCHGILEHNLELKTWHWIRTNSFFLNMHYHMHRGFHFQPRLWS